MCRPGLSGSFCIWGHSHNTYASRGGGGLAKAYALYKKYHFSYAKCVLEGGGGGNKIFDFVRTYYVNDPYGGI